MNKAEISMDEYLKLLEIKKNFDEKLAEKTKEISISNLENLKSYDKKVSIEIVELQSRNKILYSKVNELREGYRNQIFETGRLEIELREIKKPWWKKILY
jgi:intracellular sulfur oxidation DsrE/DsrF family protein